MAGIGGVRTQVPTWPLGETRSINPAGGNRQMPRRQPNKDDKNKHDEDEDKNDPFHIDEYA